MTVSTDYHINTGSDGFVDLDPTVWSGSYNGIESSLHQLAPFVGKLKSGMVKALVELFSQPGEVILDPFCGSGVVPLEAALLGRKPIGNDLSPYAWVITKGKLTAPKSKEEALQKAISILNEVDECASDVDNETVPEWVKKFYHPRTLKEILVAFQLLWERADYFTMACLLGILHHVRPGFLSYPASHLTPYLRIKKYPLEAYPDMYAYRDLRSRLLAKIERAYRRPLLPESWKTDGHVVLRVNSMNLPELDESVDLILSSPPYFGALDYARDNRLRLWFLGIQNWKELDAELTSNDKVYIPQMIKCVTEMYRVLKPEHYCVLVLGDVERDGRIKNTASVIAELAREVSKNKFIVQGIFQDVIPDERRSRRNTRTTRYEKIVVLQKTA